MCFKREMLRLHKVFRKSLTYPINKGKYLILVLVGIIFFIYTWNIFAYVYYDGGYQVTQFLRYVNIFHEYSTKREDLKYVLQWTSYNTEPFIFMGKGQEGFIERNCPVQNCFVTGNRLYFRDVRDFDVVLFHGPEIHRSYWYFPTQRSPYQIYTFVSIESSHNYPICQNSFDGFFNRTWTYKLDSDMTFAYIIITNKQGKKIGPKREMHWMDVNKMLPIDEHVKAKLHNKTKAAAWFVSNCYSINDRIKIGRHLKYELRKYGLQLDIYGSCGDLTCGRDDEEECFTMIERDYYFYLSFENSFSEEYVTEKLLTALRHYSVPVVYGGANYSRFMPNGTYLDAKKLGVQELAKQMREIIDDKKRYYDFFKWHNHYTYLSAAEALDSAICKFCAAINDDNFIRQQNVYSDFLSWWVQPENCES